MDIIFRNHGLHEGDDDEPVQAMGGGRSHVAPIEGVRVTLGDDDMLTLSGLRRRGSGTTPLAGCWLQIATRDGNAIDRLIGELQAAKRRIRRQGRC